MHVKISLSKIYIMKNNFKFEAIYGFIQNAVAKVTTNL